MFNDYLDEILPFEKNKIPAIKKNTTGTKNTPQPKTGASKSKTHPVPGKLKSLLRLNTEIIPKAK